MLQAVDAGEVDGILVEILKHVGNEKNWHDAEIDLSKNSLGLGWVYDDIFAMFVELIVVIQLCRGHGRNFVYAGGSILKLRLIDLLLWIC